MKTQNSIRQLVGRAIAQYNREQHNDATGYVTFGGPDASRFTVHTTVAKGDNVPWAKKPQTYVFNSLNRFGIKADFSSEQHSQGNVSMSFSQEAKINLCDLPLSEFELGGEFDRAARKAGYASGKTAANDLNLWGMTVEQALAAIKA